jgi:DNA-binding transcriptional MerR regulator
MDERTDLLTIVYDAACAARVELIRTLRELGLGLDDVRRVLERRATVGELAAAHVAAIDMQIRAPEDIDPGCANGYANSASTCQRIPLPTR